MKWRQNRTQNERNCFKTNFIHSFHFFVWFLLARNQIAAEFLSSLSFLSTRFVKKKDVIIEHVFRNEKWHKRNVSNMNSIRSLLADIVVAKFLIIFVFERGEQLVLLIYWRLHSITCTFMNGMDVMRTKWCFFLYIHGCIFERFFNLSHVAVWIKIIAMFSLLGKYYVIKMLHGWIFQKHRVL